MCMEDIRLGRSLGYREFRVQTIASAPRMLIVENPRRTRLLISPGGASALMLGSRDLKPSDTAGIYMDFRRPPYILTVEEWGLWLQGEIWVDDMATATLITVIEWELGKQ